MLAVAPISIHAPAWGATGIADADPAGDLFQFTPPRGGRHLPVCSCGRRSHFNSRPRVGGDQDAGAHRLGGINFNSRPRVGGDSFPEPLCKCVLCISIHAPAWGATLAYMKILYHNLFQFTPPRGGRLQLGFSAGTFTFISIHAPAWGATVNLVRHVLFYMISIHAPAWGATRRAAVHGPRGTDFNSRPRVGGDISPLVSPASFRTFQFTPPRGGRPCSPALTSVTLIYFNSRPRVGGDVSGRRYVLGLWYFNSRPRVGGDGNTMGFSLDGGLISIHAPAWGATVYKI